MFKPCKIVLKELRNITGNTEKPLTFIGNHTQIGLFDNLDIFYDYHAYENEINGIIRQLTEYGYLYYVNDTEFGLTLKGLHPWMMKFDSFREWFFHTFLGGIITGIVSTIGAEALLYLGIKAFSLLTQSQPQP